MTTTPNYPITYGHKSMSSWQQPLHDKAVADKAKKEALLEEQSKRTQIILDRLL